jgi:hypothetical protein
MNFSLLDIKKKNVFINRVNFFNIRIRFGLNISFLSILILDFLIACEL